MVLKWKVFDFVLVQFYSIFNNVKMNQLAKFLPPPPFFRGYCIYIHTNYSIYNIRYSSGTHKQWNVFMHAKPVSKTVLLARKLVHFYLINKKEG